MHIMNLYSMCIPTWIRCNHLPNYQIDTPLKFNNSPLSMFGIHSLAHKIAIALQKPTKHNMCIWKKYANFHH